MAATPELNLSEHDKKVLSSVGHGAYGKELIQILAKVKNQLCSLEGIERGGDYGEQVEGRLLFKDFANEFIRHLSFEKHVPHKLDPVDFS